MNPQLNIAVTAIGEAIVGIASFKAGINSSYFGEERVKLFTELFKKVSKVTPKKIWEPYMAPYFDELCYQSSAPFTGKKLNLMHEDCFNVICDALLEEAVTYLENKKDMLNDEIANLQDIDYSEEMVKMGVPEWDTYMGMDTKMSKEDEDFVTEVFFRAFLYADGVINSNDAKFITDWRRVMNKINQNLSSKSTVGYTFGKMKRILNDIENAEKKEVEVEEP